MGVVYRAHHALLKRPTAVKLLLPDHAGEHNIARFEREVQMTSVLTHPNTIAIYDFGRTPEGVFYYAMEYLEGIDLQNLVEHDGPQPEGRVIHVLQQVCGALGEAHGIGLIHRDIKPANIFLCERGGLADVAKVLDFGLVKSMDQSVAPALTAVDQITGTPLYMPPEAMVSPERTEARSDLYALAAVGYFLLTGTPVFEGRTVVEVGAQHLHSPPVRPSQRLGRPVSPDLEDALLAALEKDPGQRPADAKAFAARLARCRSGPTWSSDEGRVWWEQRGREVRARAHRPAQIAAGHRELTIDVAGRVGV
jgi:eukaryotic-like serine/threonine-protein kinase